MNSSMAGYSGMRGATGASSGSGGNKVPKGYSLGQTQNFSPEQMQLFQSLFSQVGPESYTSRLAGGDQKLFDEMEAPALRQFNGLQGQLASRFSGMGSGARRSSGFQNAAGAQASDFAQQLQSRRQGLQRQAIQDLMGMSSDLLGQRPYEQFLVQKPQKPGFWQQLLGGLSGGVGQAAGAAGAMYGMGKTGMY